MPSVFVGRFELGGIWWKTSSQCCSYCTRTAQGSSTNWGLLVRDWVLGVGTWTHRSLGSVCSLRRSPMFTSWLCLHLAAPWAVCQLHDVMPAAAQTLSVPLPPLQWCWVTWPLAEQAPMCRQPGPTAWLGDSLEREHLEGSWREAACNPFMGTMFFQAFHFSGWSSWVWHICLKWCAWANSDIPGKPVVQYPPRDEVFLPGIRAELISCVYLTPFMREKKSVILWVVHSLLCKYICLATCTIPLLKQSNVVDFTVFRIILCSYFYCLNRYWGTSGLRSSSASWAACFFYLN